MVPLLLPSSPIHSFPATPKLSFRSKPRPIIRAAAGLEVDSFTKKSGYLFQLSAFEAESLLDYSPSRIAAIYRRKPLILLRRLIQVGTTFGKWFGVRYIDNLMERSDQMFKVRAAELRKILVELGPAYIKIAQAVSSRPDLIPPSYLDELSLLQDRITPFSTEVALDTIEKELGLRIDELFSEISPEPVAAASLGQVYQARLRRSGQVVAVKVQRPGVQAAISLDILILRFLAGVVKKAGKFNTDLQAVIDEWASSLFREMDYRKEADNGLKFRRLYGGLKDVFVPNINMEHTTRRVLVMEWVEGQKLSEVKDLYLVEVGVYCSFNQLLENGFYHADPHPGNLFRTFDGKLAYIDFGMMGEFKQEFREGFIEACLHLVNRDFDALSKDFVTLGLLPPTAEKEAVTKALTGVFQDAVAKGVRNISFGDLLGNLGTTILAVLEGIAISSDPNYKVLGSTYPWIAKKVLTDSSPQLKSSLQALLYKDGAFRIDRLESLLTESLRARTEKALVKIQREEANSRVVFKEILYFTLTEKGSFVREILIEEFAKGLDALGLATLDSLTSVATTRIPFTGSSVSFMSKEDIINLRTFHRLMFLLAGLESNKKSFEEVNGVGNPNNNQSAYLEESSLLSYQPALVSEILAMLSIIPELPPELQQQLLRLPADLARRLISRASARTIQRIFL
ncbi:uncharacterized aarF domain-containing protein kinase At1g71810, chloroplastic isoform X4 [Gossypium raimondii]|uniref:Protein kinase domain-containing protein n=1 Tax=Gossypium raimondii TaxID=29730 RepID=A0A0D2V9L7_GOSRA|nr:uncharacterized aarF domain-containing protein kinase At1g71810, chloroplastic isoform X4 [Gossypium raimondii]KJB66170.1 hypothetical protein B456_010G130800 [Gossypium raimondii]